MTIISDQPGPPSQQPPDPTVSTGKIVYRLKVLDLRTAVLYSYMQQGWTLTEVMGGRDAILRLRAQSGLADNALLHCTVLFGQGTQNQPVQPNLSSAARSFIAKNQMVANGLFLLIKPPYLYEMLLRVITLGRSTQFLIVKAQNPALTPEAIALLLETLMTQSGFEAVVKKLSLRTNGKVIVEDLQREMNAVVTS